MTFRAVGPALVVGLIALAGGRIRIEENDGEPFVVVSFPGDGLPPPEYAEHLSEAWGRVKEFKPRLVELLRLPAEVRERLADAALLREGLHRRVAAPCGFFCGPSPGGPCVRCGGGWRDHFQPKRMPVRVRVTA